MAKDAVRITRIKFHYEGFNELRKAPGVQAELARRAQAIMHAAGGYPEFNFEVGTNKSRARAVVLTANFDGMLAEARDRALTKALGAGRG